MAKRNLLLFLFFGVIFWGCEPGNPNPISEYDYYPLRLNAPLVYELTETRYAAGNTAPTITTWFERDEAIRRTESLDGFPVFVFARSRRNTSTDVWQKIKEYTVTQYPDKYLVSIDNVTTAPVVFPIRTANVWDLNAYNTRDREDCRYEYVNQERTIGELHFERTVQVSGRNLTNDPIVRYNLGYSQYALGVGLVYDEQTDYDYCQEEHCFGQQQIASGVSTIRKLVAYERL